MDDAGKYTCKASIADGEVTMLVQVKQVTVGELVLFSQIVLK